MSVVSGIFRGARRSQSGDAPEVLDMDELERSLREAREGELVGEPSSPSSPPVSPPVAREVSAPSVGPSEPERPRPSVTAARRATPTVHPSTLAERTPLQPSWVVDDDDADWTADVDDAEWEAMEEEGTPRRTAAGSSTPAGKAAGGRLPDPVQAYLDKGRPWQAAFVVQEVLGPPRALAPYRTWPRT